MGRGFDSRLADFLSFALFIYVLVQKGLKYIITDLDPDLDPFFLKKC